MSNIQNLNIQIIDGKQKMMRAKLIMMIENADFEAVERDTVYNRVERVAA